jgi:hypothetical protein
MPWYCRVKAAINTAMPFLVPTQATNLALLVSAILKKQTLCLSELARAYPTTEKRRVPAPKHDLLHRLKRLWRFTNNERVDPLEVQMALVPYTIACLGFPRFLGLAIDWTMFETTLPSGHLIRNPGEGCHPILAGGRESAERKTTAGSDQPDSVLQASP